MRLSFVTENTVDVASDVNQSLLDADGLIVSRVSGIVTVAPPTAADGLRLAISAGATGFFAGMDGQLGVYVATGNFWIFYNPVLCVYDNAIYISTGTDWVAA